MRGVGQESLGYGYNAPEARSARDDEQGSPSTMKNRDAHHLLGCHANGLDCEFTTAHVEQVFQVWSQEVDDENIVETLLTEIMHLRHASYTANDEHMRCQPRLPGIVAEGIQ